MVPEGGADSEISIENLFRESKEPVHGANKTLWSWAQDVLDHKVFGSNSAASTGNGVLGLVCPAPVRRKQLPVHVNTRPTWHYREPFNGAHL